MSSSHMILDDSVISYTKVSDKEVFWGGFVDCYVLLTIGLSVKNFLGGKTLIMVIMVVMSMAISHGDNEIADDDGGGDVNGNLTCG